MPTEDTQISPAQRAQRDRSPAHPFISLKAAFERAAAFEAKFGRHGSPYNKIGLAWGYKGDGSQAQQTTSALKYFGLVEYTGPTNDRLVVLTEDARNYMRAQQASTKTDIARACALRPKVMQMYWERWGADRPIDEICLDQMILKDKFTESAAKAFLKVYDETIAFAGLKDGSKVETEGGDEQQERGSDRDASVQPQSERTLSPAPIAQPAPLPAGRLVLPPKGVGMRREVFSLTEGDVVIQWPEHLSQESFEDVSDWLQILQRKIKRSVAQPAAPTTASGRRTGSNDEQQEDAPA
jgi:hypothetical protein